MSNQLILAGSLDTTSILEQRLEETRLENWNVCEFVPCFRVRSALKQNFELIVPHNHTLCASPTRLRHSDFDASYLHLSKTDNTCTFLMYRPYTRTRASARAPTCMYVHWGRRCNKLITLARAQTQEVPLVTVSLETCPRLLSSPSKTLNSVMS